MVIQFVAYLIELGYFKREIFVFLVVGHTKNATDRLRNALKEIYWCDNIGTMKKLYEKLNTSAKVTVYETDESQFFDWGEYLDLFYRELSGLVKQNHVFYESSNMPERKQTSHGYPVFRHSNLHACLLQWNQTNILWT